MKLSYPIAPKPPAQGPVIGQLFGQAIVDYSQFDMKGHNGMDFRAPIGMPILAVADGWIVEQTEKRPATVSALRSS